jgi:hypothetical protein
MANTGLRPNDAKNLRIATSPSLLIAGSVGGDR